MQFVFTLTCRLGVVLKILAVYASKESCAMCRYLRSRYYSILYISPSTLAENLMYQELLELFG